MMQVIVFASPTVERVGIAIHFGKLKKKKSDLLLNKKTVVRVETDSFVRFVYGLATHKSSPVLAVFIPHELSCDTKVCG
jgi:hypothetical protein